MEMQDFYYQYHEKVRRYVFQVMRNESVADDIVQDTFLRVITHRHSVHDPRKIVTWMFSIAHNLCMDYIRRSRDVPLEEQPLPEEDGTAEYIPMIKEIEQRQMGTCIQQQMDRLPENLRTVIVLRDTLEFTVAETAEILNISKENAKVRLHRARMKLREILSSNCNFEHDERNVLVCSPH